jgi:hypothetical protein
METKMSLRIKKDALLLAAWTSEEKSSEIRPQYLQREKYSLAGIPGIQFLFGGIIGVLCVLW